MNLANLQIILWKEGEYFVAQCLNVDVSSFGDSKVKALANLKEALELYFEDSTQELPTVEQPEVIPMTLSYV